MGSTRLLLPVDINLDGCKLGIKRIAWLHGFPHLLAVFCMHWFRTGILNAHPVFDGE
jgi:hypothetical protein